MIYKNSKGEEKDIADMNIFELENAAKKVDRNLNALVGFANRHMPYDAKELFQDLDRYLNILRDNLWAEVRARDITGKDADFEEAFGHLGEADKVALKNFIKTNFVAKE